MWQLGTGEANSGTACIWSRGVGPQAQRVGVCRGADSGLVTEMLPPSIPMALPARARPTPWLGQRPELWGLWRLNIQATLTPCFQFNKTPLFPCSSTMRGSSLLLGAYACVRACVHVCVQVCACACTHAHGSLCAHVCAHVYVCMCLCFSAHVYMCTCTCACVCVCVHVCICARFSAHTRAHMYVCTCTFLCARLRACVCLCAHTCACVCACMCAHACVLGKLPAPRRPVRPSGVGCLGRDGGELFHSPRLLCQ